MINIDDETITLDDRIIIKDGKKYHNEKWTYKTDKLYYDDKDKTFIEFEISNIGNIDIHEPKKTFETVKNYYSYYNSFNDDIDKTETVEELGTFLKEVINNYDIYMKIIYEHIDMLYESKRDWRNKKRLIKKKVKNNSNDYINECKQLDIKLNKTLVSILWLALYKLSRNNLKLSMLSNYIGEYMQNCYKKHLENIDDLEKRIAQRKKRNPNLSYKFNTNMTEHEQKMTRMYRDELQKLKRNNSVYSSFKIVNNCFGKLLENFRYGKKLIDNSFISTNGNKGKKFSYIDTSLPNVKIEYMIDDNFKSPKPFKYTYEIKSLIDLFNVTIYQLSLSHQPILICKNCKKYFIPRIKFDEKTGKNKRVRDDILYCDDKCKSQYRNRNRDLQKEETTQYYETLRKRYNANPIYHKELEKLKKLHQDCKSKQLDDEEIMRILTDFEEDVKSRYNVKPGRPPKKKQ